MADPVVRHAYLLVFEIDSDGLFFTDETVMYKIGSGPPWEHFARFDQIADVYRAYHRVLVAGASRAQVTHREITTAASDPEVLDMAAVGDELREQRAKARARGVSRS